MKEYKRLMTTATLRKTLPWILALCVLIVLAFTLQPKVPLNEVHDVIQEARTEGTSSRVVSFNNEFYATKQELSTGSGMGPGRICFPENAVTVGKLTVDPVDGSIRYEGGSTQSVRIVSVCNDTETIVDFGGSMDGCVCRDPNTQSPLTAGPCCGVTATAP